MDDHPPVAVEDKKHEDVLARWPSPVVPRLALCRPSQQSINNHYLFAEHFTRAECQAIERIAFAHDPEPEAGTVAGVVNLDYRTSTIRWLPEGPATRWIYTRILACVDSANRALYNFVLAGLREKLQFAEYDGKRQGHYDWHMDCGAGTASLRKLSVTVQLSDDASYEGGTLEFMHNNTPVQAPKSQGTVVVFPSFAMHRVMPVTSGQRRSLVLWVSGATPFQ